MMRYSFWYGHGCTVGDLSWLVQAFKLLKDNEWRPESPLYFDGSGWESSVREAAAISLLNALAMNCTAQTLYLQNADLDLKAQNALASVFAENSSLKRISLKNLRCNDGPMIIPHTLFSNPRLTELSIAECLLDEQGCHLMSGMLRSSSNLETLSITKVAFSCQGFAILCDGIKSSRYLRTLNMRSLVLSSRMRIKLLDALTRNSSISSLDLEGIGLGVAEAKAVARLTAKNSVIEKLSLRKNELNGDAIHIVMQSGILKNQTLKSLFLSKNPVGNDGAKSIADGLVQQHSLRHLCLIQSGILREGCIALCEGIMKMRGIRSIALDNNEIEKCAQALLQAVQANVYIYSVLECLNSLTKYSHEKALWQKIDMYLTMNKANRRVITEETISEGALLRVISSTSNRPDFVYELLKQMPVYTSNAGQLRQ